jgi:hypothetical protein
MMTTYARTRQFILIAAEYFLNTHSYRHARGKNHLSKMSDEYKNKEALTEVENSLKN